MSRIMWVALALGVAMSVSACGSDTYLQVQSGARPSKGKELEDLKRALDAGAINQQEYDRLHPILLNRPN